MSLKQWADDGWLRPHNPSRQEIAGLLAIVERDIADAGGDIPVPPKYKSADFQAQVYWRLRGKLDVPKERFVSYPGCERDADPSLLIAWAGWDHLQQAQALAAYYESVRSNECWSSERLVPLLAGLLELVPWLLQWHNEIDPHYNQRMGDFFKGSSRRRRARWARR